MQGGPQYSGGLRAPNFAYGSSGIPTPSLSAGVPGIGLGQPEDVHPDDQANGVVNNNYNVLPYEILQGYYAEQKDLYVMTFVPHMSEHDRRLEIQTFRQRNRARLGNDKRKVVLVPNRNGFASTDIGLGMFLDPISAFNFRAVNFHLLHFGKSFKEGNIEKDDIMFMHTIAKHFRTLGGVRTNTLVQHNQNQDPVPRTGAFGQKGMVKATPIPNFVVVGQSGEVDIIDEWGCHYRHQPENRESKNTIQQYVRLPEKSGLFAVMYMRRAAQAEQQNFVLGCTRERMSLPSISFSLEADEVYWTIEPWASNDDIMGEPQFYCDDDCIAMYACYIGTVGWQTKTYDIKRMPYLKDDFNPMRDGDVVETAIPKFNPWLNFAGREWCLIPMGLLNQFIAKIPTERTFMNLMTAGKEYLRLRKMKPSA